MYRNILLALAVIFIIACNSTESMFIHYVKDIGRKQNIDKGYVYMIRSTHALKKRDVYSIDTVIPGVQPKEETVVIVPNSGMNSYPYSNYYPRNPASRYGGNTGTTVIVSNPDSNYDNVYGGKYLPNKYANKYG